MKKWYLIFIAISLTIGNFAKCQTIYWSEDFEGSTSAWSVDAGTWEMGVPTSGPNAAHGGTKCAATVLNGNYSCGVNSRLISPSIIIPQINDNPRLRFWHWFSIANSDYGKVQIKPIGNPNWVDLSSEYINSGSGAWSKTFLDLSNFAGQQVQIAFLFYSDAWNPVSSGWYIDDISIDTGAIIFNNPEDWENGIGDWSSSSGTWEVGTPSIVGPSVAHSGQKCAGTRLNGNYECGANSRLVSPVFTVPDSIQNPRLRFWHWFNFASSDSGIVQLKIVGNQNWINLNSGYINSSGGIWSQPSFYLNSYWGQQIQIGFLVKADEWNPVSSGWYIDDLEIEYYRYHDASVTKIISPDTIVALHDTIIPKAIVKNFGLLADTILVHFSIYPVYSDSTTIILQPNQSDTVTFAAWVPSVQNTYSTLCHTQLASDELHTNDSLTKTVLVSSGILEIHSITPNKGGNTGSVTVEISGLGFMPGAIVKLRRTGQQDVIADTAIVDTSNYNKLRTRFYLNNIALGQWSIVVINPNSDSTISYNSFIIQNVNEDLWFSVTGSNQIRVGDTVYYIVSYGNNGNIDANDLIMEINGSTVANYSINYPKFPYPINYPANFTDGFVDSLTYTMPIWLLNISSGSSHHFLLKIFISQGVSHAHFPIEFNLYKSPPTQFSLTGNLDTLISSMLLDSLSNIIWRNWPDTSKNTPPNISIIKNEMISFWKDMANYFKIIQSSSGQILGATIANITGSTIVAEAGMTLGGLAQNALMLSQFMKAYRNMCLGLLNQKMFPEIINSWDPNDKFGPIGYDTINFIKQELPMYYTIRFENVDSATASAQYIKITDTLEANLNWSTVTFDNTSHSVSSITFDTITGVIKWEFNNINLPPNVNPPEGEGWVVFHVNQNPGLPTGTHIKNKASIVFDYNPPIITNEWINTIDRGAPSSTVTLATYLDSTSYRIYWSGQDDNLGSGIKEYSIYYTDNIDSAYVLWKRTSDTSAVFTGIKDSTYYFYSVATDNVSHKEEYPGTYDLALTIVDHSGISENTTDNKIMIFPNPAKSQITVKWKNPIKVEYNLALYDMYGNRLINFRGIKSERKIIDISNLKSGVYFIQLTGNKVYSSKFIKID